MPMKNLLRSYVVKIGPLFERFLKLYCEPERNTRSVTLVGSDLVLIGIYNKLKDDATLSYKILGYYGDEALGGMANDVEKLTKRPGKERGLLRRLGSMKYFLKTMEKRPDELKLGDELYLCVSRREKDVIRRISEFCDHQAVRFFYVPVSVESIGPNLKREFLDDIEIYATYDKHAY